MMVAPGIHSLCQMRRIRLNYEFSEKKKRETKQKTLKAFNQIFTTENTLNTVFYKAKQE